MNYNEDPDFVMTGKQNDANISNDLNDFTLTFIDLLANYNDKLDPQNYKTSLSSCIGEWLKIQDKEKPNAVPYVKIVDLNNSKDQPYENKPKDAIEVGIKAEF